MPHILRYLLTASCATLVALTAACSAIQSKEVTVRATVQYATMKVISQSNHITASDVIDHVQRVREYVNADGGSFTIAVLSEQVRSQIRWERLDIADVVLLNTLLDEAARRLQERVGEGMLSPDAKVTVDILLDWIEESALLLSDIGKHGQQGLATAVCSLTYEGTGNLSEAFIESVRIITGDTPLSAFICRSCVST